MAKKKRIYLDHAATTPVSKEAIQAMRPYFIDKFGNASSIHKTGYEAKQALVSGRDRVAKVLKCQPDEIIFTSGGTESNNLALAGVAEFRNYKGHIIVSAIEHHSVLDVAEYLHGRGVDVTFIKPDKEGMVSPPAVKKAIRKDTFLVSIIYANNEIGAIEPIAEIGNIVQKAGVLMHTDAVQAPGALRLDVNKLHVDLMSLSAHKFYGPKGVGLLYVRRGTKLAPQMLGGGQEQGRRSGTENIPGIIGLAAALEAVESRRESEVVRLSKFRDWLIGEIEKSIPRAVLTGHRTKRLPGLVSFCFPPVEGEMLVLRLAECGYQCSSGSACSTGSPEPSHVLLSIGLDKRTARASLRISIGKDITQSQLRRFAKILAGEVDKLNKT